MEKADSLTLQKFLKEELLKKYTEEQLQNPTEEMGKDIQVMIIKMGLDMIYNKPVWFRICDHYGKYYITMYYDNEYNHADGEDL